MAPYHCMHLLQDPLSSFHGTAIQCPVISNFAKTVICNLISLLTHHWSSWYFFPGFPFPISGRFLLCKLMAGSSPSTSPYLIVFLFLGVIVLKSLPIVNTFFERRYINLEIRWVQVLLESPKGEIVHLVDFTNITDTDSDPTGATARDLMGQQRA